MLLCFQHKEPVHMLLHSGKLSYCYCYLITHAKFLFSLKSEDGSNFKKVRLPRRPVWTEGLSADELHLAEVIGTYMLHCC
jgi:hypothetical protein